MIAPLAGSEPSLELLRESVAFEGVDDDLLAEIDLLLRPVVFGAGEPIVREGDAAESWFLIADGTASVTHADLTGQAVTLAVLGPGDSFGERALLGDGQPRQASVHAVTPVQAYALDAAVFERVMSLESRESQRLSRRLEVMAIDAALKRASPFATLPRESVWSLAEHLEVQRATAGDVIMREGDPGDCFYVIRSGAVAVVREGRRVATLRAGDSLGEIALLTPAPRTATARALNDTELLVLTRDAFQAAANGHATLANYFRELIGVRFRGAAGQHVLLPDPLTSLMPLVSPRRRKRYWLVLVLGVTLFVLLSLAALLHGGPTAIYAVMIVGALIGPVVFVQYLAESNILSERPLELVVTAVLGAALGLPPAISLQQHTDLLPGSLSSALAIALIEEPAKILGVVWLLRLPALRFRMDGVIFGAAAGMGFATLEIALYASERIETVPGLLGVLWLRALLSPFTHGTWTAIVCATIWRERSAGWWRGGPRIGAAFGAVVVLHALWDWHAVPLPWNFLWLLLVGAASLYTLRLILQQAALEEARSVTALAPELVRATPTSVGLRCVGCARRAPPGARYCPRCGLALHV